MEDFYQHGSKLNDFIMLPRQNEFRFQLCRGGKEKKIFEYLNYIIVSIGYEVPDPFKDPLKVPAFVSDGNCEIWEIVSEK
jgi:hypothetical protein